MEPKAAVDEKVLPVERHGGGNVSRAHRDEARIFALSIVRDPEYRTNLLLAARSRTLAPAVETMLHHYANGKPPDRLELGGPGDFAELETMSEVELAEHADLVAERLRSGFRDVNAGKV